MDENTNVAPAGAVGQSPISIEDKLASFDFDAPAPPAGDTQEPVKEAEDDAIVSTLVGETPEEPAPPDDDPEVNLRDNTKVRLSELKRAYHPEWQKHLAEFSQKQQAFEQATAGFTQQQQQTAQLLQQAVSFVEARLPKAPDIALIDTDPFEYQRQKAHYDAEIGKLDQLRGVQAQFHQQTEQQARQQFQQYLTQQYEAALQSLPHLRDPVKKAKWTEEVKSLGAELGFTPQEVNGIHDHRVLKLIDLATKAKKYEAAIEKAKAKLKEAAPPPVAVQAPQRRKSPAEVRSEDLRSRLDKLRKTGNPRDAEDVLSRFD